MNPYLRFLCKNEEVTNRTGFVSRNIRLRKDRGTIFQSLKKLLHFLAFEATDAAQTFQLKQANAASNAALLLCPVYEKHPVAQVLQIKPFEPV